MPASTDEAATVRATPSSRTVDVNRLGEALVSGLKSALGRHGITLPSLQADYPLGDKPLIMLGRANQETVERLTALLDSIEPAAD
ncbi:hypothetical protein [Streptacidiphilus neutrinimicus]|uniref:hypothetical protein n=1 Tax=Streptacidiphilus neutrinimicus TaxID=105420 RepID=UPI001F21A689|nr:hypothetical protein [Streptacidiphilus neutrinimicus]